MNCVNLDELIQRTMHGNTEASTNEGKAGDNSVLEPGHQVDD